MDLSVIIVNYNVKSFLEQCLHAVLKASQDMKAEVIVVDNNSADGSVQMIVEKFPQVLLIANHHNQGFAKANNQAIKQSTGKYILLLNPDTLVQEDTFVKCLDYMNSHPDAGCLGVKMINGKGRYLPESKRALPTPIVAFYKVFGFAALFPRSKRFGKYHLGYLNREQIHDVDVISGAFMFIRKAALDKTGLLDEQFFMYGEDIDLSYRLTLAGYRNVYFPLTTIIHYKGESTRKSSINYVIMFYKAMIIFARKHFGKNTIRYYSSFINIAIYIRAGISIFLRFLKGILNPLLDALVIYAGYLAFLPVWERHLFSHTGSYPPVYMTYVVPAYTIIWLISIYAASGFEKKIWPSYLIKGTILGTVIILIIYALLPETLRFSRALILIGACWTLFSAFFIRFLLHILNRKNFSFELLKSRKRILIIGSSPECQRVHSIIDHASLTSVLVGYVNTEEQVTDQDYIGHIGQVEDIVRMNQVDEIIFCGADITSQQIIKTILLFTERNLEFKIAPPESKSIIGSSSSETIGEIYLLNVNTLSLRSNKRKKRLFDILISVVFVITSPVWVFMVNHPLGLLRNVFRVILGIYSWVGYAHSKNGFHADLPPIKPGIFAVYSTEFKSVKENDRIDKANLQYVKDYRMKNDLYIILNELKSHRKIREY
jgi:O-antigen biosynthesis protein